MKRTDVLSAMLIRIHERNNKRLKETDLLKSDEAGLFMPLTHGCLRK